jgi:hypothetical protein
MLRHAHFSSFVIASLIPALRRDDNPQRDPETKYTLDFRMTGLRISPLGYWEEIKMKKLLLCLFIAVIFVAFLGQEADAAKWKFHGYLTKGGELTVYGTINCQTVGPPLFVGHVDYCNTVSGWVPPWCNDYLTVFYWAPPGYTCGNKDSVKVAVKHYDGGKWKLEPLDAWMVANLPSAGTILPTMADSTGFNQYVHIMVNLEEWLADERPLQDVYDVVNGECPDLPGYMIGTTPIVFDSLAGPGSDPFSTTPLTGLLQRDGDITFTNEQIPTLSEYGLIILVVLLLGGAVLVIRRRRRVAAH